MALEYTNRKGDIYFLQEGKTKTGKPKYYFARKLRAAAIDKVPRGFEVRENPVDAVVTLRRAKLTQIDPLEKKFVEDRVRRYAGIEHFIVDVDGDNIIIYLPGNEETGLDKLVSDMLGPLAALAMGQNIRDKIIANMIFSPMLRFELIDSEERLFTALRWCFCGSIDDWIHLFSAPQTLADLTERFARHLGKDSFHELI
jgi:hypothetical protein